MSVSEELKKTGRQPIDYVEGMRVESEESVENLNKEIQMIEGVYKDTQLGKEVKEKTKLALQELYNIRDYEAKQAKFYRKLYYKAQMCQGLSS